MGGIRTAEAVGVFSLECSFKCGEIVLWNYTVGVEKHEVFTPGMLHAIVSGNAASLVALVEILYGNLVGVGIYCLLAGKRGAVLHNHHLKVALGLCGEARKQVAHLVDAVVHRNYN